MQSIYYYRYLSLQATGQRIGTVLQAFGTFTFSLAVSLYYEWRLGLVALAFVPLMAAVLYKQGRMVTAESFGTAKTMEQSSKVRRILIQKFLKTS